MAPLTFCGLHSGLVGSQLLDESQLQWLSAGCGTDASHARIPTIFFEDCPNCPISASTPSRVSPCQKSVIRCPTPKLASSMKGVTMSKSPEELAREVARVQGQPAGREEDSETSDESGPFPVPNSARVVSGRRHHRLRMLVDHLMCSRWKIGTLALGAKSCNDPRRKDGIIKPLLGRSSSLHKSTRFFWSKTSRSTVRGSRIPTTALSRELSITTRKLPRFQRCLKAWRQLTPARTRRAMPAPVWEGIAAQVTHLNQLQMAAFIPILLVTYTRRSELVALRKKDLVPPLVPHLPCWSVVFAASETGVPAKTGVRGGSVFVDQLWLQWANKLLDRLEAGNPEETIWNSDYRGAEQMFWTATDSSELSGMTMYQTRLSGASIEQVRDF